VTVQVPEFNSLGEMTLQIGNTKTTDSDPFNQNNWYRIIKARGDSKVYVQNKIGTVMSNKAILDWAGATGSLTISVSTGSIALYENGTLRYSEPFALPSYNCYIYIFTSTDRSTSSGTDKFDNFAINPTSAFKDDFNDGNYNGWTVYSGTWSVVGGKLKADSSGIIYNNANFPCDRVVQSELRTETAGQNPYDVAILIIKWDDFQNQITTRLFTDGTIELIMWKNGNMAFQTQVNSDLNPYEPHIFTASVIGTNIKVYIDETLYIDANSNYFDDIAGHVGYQTGPSSYFDDMTVW